MNNLQTSSVRQKSHNKAVFTALIALLFLMIVLSLSLGTVWLSPIDMWRAIFGSETEDLSYRILCYFRLPRTCGALLAGAALATSGAMIQGVLSNPLAAPHIIGVNAGAGLAVILVCAVAPTTLALVPITAFLGALGGVLMVIMVAEKSGASKITLVLTGVAISNIFSAGIDAIITFFPDALMGYSDFRIGGLNGVTMERLVPAFWIIVISFLIALSLSNELDILLLGTDTAQSLGLPARRLRLVLLAVAAALSGAAVSFSGLLGFVGLIVPHIMRRLVGEESKLLLLSSALGGAIFLTGCDLLARILFSPFEIPVGIVLSFVGGPFFIWLLLQQRGGRIHG